MDRMRCFQAFNCVEEKEKWVNKKEQENQYMHSEVGSAIAPIHRRRWKQEEAPAVLLVKLVRLTSASRASVTLVEGCLQS